MSIKPQKVSAAFREMVKPPVPKPQETKEGRIRSRLVTAESLLIRGMLPEPVLCDGLSAMFCAEASWRLRYWLPPHPGHWRRLPSTLWTRPNS